MAEETRENAMILLERLADRIDDMIRTLENVSVAIGQAMDSADELEFVVSQDIDPVFDALEQVADWNAECMMFLDEYPNGEEE